MNNSLENIKEVPKLSEPHYIIEGGNSLNGEVVIPGAKNAALPAIVAACLTDEPVTLKNVPIELNDVKLIIDLLRDMGAVITIDEGKKELVCCGENWKSGSLNPDKASKIRHSLLLLGLAGNWKKELFLPFPGGCDLGNRKHDMHVDALSALGNKVKEEEGILLKPSENPENVNIEFYYPTFGGTLNAIFAGVQLENCNITISNAARNPEVLDVISLLNQMGSKIKWVDQETISIKGVSKLKGTTYSVMPDRIIAATVITATAITNGNVTLKNFNSNLLDSELNVWKNAGLNFEITKENNLHIQGKTKLVGTHIETKAYPGFHTDIQPLHTLLMTFAKGESSVKETILDGRFRYCTELNKMGADISVTDGDFYCVNGAKGQIAKIKGIKRLTGTDVSATDIRGGAAVAVAGLAAEGVTRVTNLYQIERGYENFVELFNSLGANIRRSQS